MTTDDTRPPLPDWLADAMDLGIYPKATPTGERTPYQDGWNAASIAICDAVEKAYATLAAPAEPAGFSVSMSGEPYWSETPAAPAENDDVIDRLTRALRVAAHSPHDQLGEPNEGFPTCSKCGAIQTQPAAPAEGPRDDIRWMLDNCQPMHGAGCPGHDACVCGITDRHDSILERAAQPAAPAEGLNEALETHPWVWDTLPGDVQDAINALRRPVLKEWASPAVARRAEIARNAELRRAAMAYLAHLDTDQGDNNSGQMLEWAATEDRLREDLRAALERTDR